VKRERLIFIFIFLCFTLFSLDYIIPQYSYSVRSGDLNGNGHSDIVVGHFYQNGIISFLYNNGNGEFTLEDTLLFFGAGGIYEITNLDENPINDLIVHYVNGYGGTQHFAVFYNNDFNNIRFYDTGISGYGMSHQASGDISGNGYIDLVFSFTNSPLWCVFYNLGNQEFSEPVFYEHSSMFIKCEDLDGDGLADVVTQSNELWVHYSTGNGFESELLTTGITNAALIVADMDNDGKYDIVVNSLFTPRFRMFENLGNRNWQLHIQNVSGSFNEALTADINGDGFINIVNIIGPPSFGYYHNLGNFVLGAFENVYVGYYEENNHDGWIDDFDGNGTPDVAIARNIYSQPSILSIFYNDGFGNFSEEPVSIELDEIPIPNYILNNYPNPFNPTTTIQFSGNLFADKEAVTIEIFNVKGQRVKQFNIYNSQFKINEVVWGGTNNYRNPVSSGMYLYQIKSSSGIYGAKKMMLLK
jgi:hypothetical protein